MSHPLPHRQSMGQTLPFISITPPWTMSFSNALQVLSLLHLVDCEHSTRPKKLNLFVEIYLSVAFVNLSASFMGIDGI